MSSEEQNSPSGVGQNTIVLTTAKGEYNLGGYLYLLEDRKGELTFKEVSSLSESFIRHMEDEPNIGFTRSVYWIKFYIHNLAPDQEWTLEHSYPPMDLIELHIPQDETGETKTVQRSGDLIPFNERPIPHRNFLFNLNPPRGKTSAYYLRFKSESAMVFPLKIWSREAFTAKDSISQLILGLYFGLLIVMILYNLLIYISSKELSYLHYIIFVTSHFFFQMCMTGAAAVYLWSRNPWWTNHSLVIFSTLSVAFAITFTREFLHTKKWVPRIHLVLNCFLALSFFNCASSLFVSYAVSIIVTNSLLLILSVVFIITAITTYRKGYLPARFYLIAWLSLLVAVLILALKTFGFVPSNFFTTNILQIGSALEVILLSFAIADRINHLRKEKEEAEQAHLISQKKALEITEEKLYTDNMTGLPNRNRLILDIQKMDQPNLFLINADHFKEINNFYGYIIGNIIIVELGNRICSCKFPYPFTVYKLHADEFALTIDSRMNRSKFEDFGEILHTSCMNEPYDIKGQVIPLEVSIGIASSKKNLLEQADMALTQARNSHKDFGIYDPSKKIVKQYENNLKWASIIRESLKNDRVFPYFQPIINNQTGIIEKYESLMRLQVEDGGIITPSKFLSIAKKSKLYSELSRLIIKKSFSVFNAVGKEFSINLSIAQPAAASKRFF